MRALAEAAEKAKRRKLGRVRIFTAAQAAIARMTHDEPGPGQTYTLQARKAIAALREREPTTETEIHRRPAHKGIPGADGWAKRAASEPDDHGVAWLAHADKYGRRSMPPAPLGHVKHRTVKHRASDKKWPEARSWCERRQLSKGYVLQEKGKPDPTPDRAEILEAVLRA